MVLKLLRFICSALTIVFLLRGHYSKVKVLEDHTILLISRMSILSSELTRIEAKPLSLESNSHKSAFPKTTAKTSEVIKIKDSLQHVITKLGDLKRCEKPEFLLLEDEEPEVGSKLDIDQDSHGQQMDLTSLRETSKMQNGDEVIRDVKKYKESFEDIANVFVQRTHFKQHVWTESESGGTNQKVMSSKRGIIFVPSNSQEKAREFQDKNLKLSENEKCFPIAAGNENNVTCKFETFQHSEQQERLNRRGLQEWKSWKQNVYPPRSPRVRRDADRQTFGTLQTQMTLDRKFEREDERKPRTLIFTCDGRCGTSLVYPCSCHMTCLLYNNCCENMTQDCPDIMRESRETFGLLFGTKQLCEDERVFQVSSCPGKGNRNSGVNNLDNLTPPLLGGDLSENRKTPSTDEITTQSGTNASRFILEEVGLALLNAPVTEDKYGITFVNRSIYDCYAELVTLGKPLTWGLAMNTLLNSPLQLSELSKTDVKNYYMPRFKNSSIEILHPALCDSKSVNTCERNIASEVTVDLENDLASRCAEFAGYVRSLSNGVVYRNRFCAFCYEGKHGNLIPFTIPTVAERNAWEVGLRVLVSFTTNHQISLELTYRPVSQPIPTWYSAKCPAISGIGKISPHHASEIVENVAYERDETICKAVCSRGFSIHSDGRCKALHHSFIGASGEDIDEWILTATNGLERFGDFVSCSLIQAFDRYWKHVEFRSPEVSVAFDKRINKELHLVKLRWYSPYVKATDFIFSYTHDDIAQNVYNAVITIKAFREYITTKSARRTDESCKTNVKTFKINVVSGDLDETLQRQNDKKTMERLVALRGRIVEEANNVSTTRTCLGSFDYMFRHKELVMCVEEPVYENDATAISALLNSTCVKHLDECNTSIAADLLSLDISIGEFYTFVVATAYYWMNS